MSLTFDVTVADARLAALPAELRAKAGDAVWKTASDIEADAKAAAPVRTGNLRNSIQAQRTGPLEALVSVGADYGIFVELGTVRRPATPYLGPAAERHRPAFLAAIASLYT